MIQVHNTAIRYIRNTSGLNHKKAQTELRQHKQMRDDDGKF